jgi:predicted nuclease with TOPRIM domain
MSCTGRLGWDRSKRDVAKLRKHLLDKSAQEDDVVDARNEELQSDVLALAEQIRQGTERETRLQASLHARDTELTNLQTALGTLHAEVRRRPPLPARREAGAEAERG